MAAHALTLEAALYYREEMNFSVVPLRPGSKRPLGSWKSYQERPLARDELLSIYDRTPTANIGIIGGSVSGNLVVIDLDTYKAEAMTRSGEKIIDRVKQLGAESWMVKTARGGLHAYIETDEPLATSSAHGFVDIRSEGAYACAPNSVFQSHGQYEFSNRPDKVLRVSLSDLDFLGIQKLELPELHKKEFHPINQEDFGPKPFGIPFSLWNKLTHGVPIGTRSQTEFSIVLYLVQRGWTFDHILTLFIQRASTKSKFKEKGTEGPHWLKAAYYKSQGWLSERKDNVRTQIQAMRQWALTRTWTSQSHLLTYLAFLDIANIAGSFEIGASEMLLAERSGLHRHTVRRILPDIGHLVSKYEPPKNDEGKLIKGAVSRFQVLGQNDTIQSQEQVIELAHFVQDFRGHDAFRHGGLGSSGFAIFAQVCLHPGLQTEAIQIGKSDRTVSRRLGQMEKYGIIENRIGWVPGTQSTEEMSKRLYRAALEFDTLGASDRQRAAHKAQRMQFKYELRRQQEEAEKREDMLSAVNLETGEILTQGKVKQ